MVLFIIYIIGFILTPMIILIVNNSFKEAKIKKCFFGNVGASIVSCIFWPISLFLMYLFVIDYIMNKKELE